MSKEELPLGELARASFQKLTESAANINAASDGLGKPIERLDAVLKKLNLGIGAWVSFADGGEWSGGPWWSHEVGYARIDGQWGISIRTVSCEPSGYESTEEWLFNDAPRRFRIDAVDALPKLLDKLSSEANTMAEKITQKVSRADEVVTAVLDLAKTVPSQKRK